MKRTLLIAGSSGYGATLLSLAVAGEWGAVAALISIPSLMVMGIAAVLYAEVVK